MRPDDTEPAPAHSAPRLTPRERQILELIAAGHDTKQIADFLSLRPKSVDARVQGMFLKFRVNRRAALVWIALRSDEAQRPAFRR